LKAGHNPANRCLTEFTMIDQLVTLSLILITYSILRDMSQRYTAEQILTGYLVIMTLVSKTLTLCPRWLRWVTVGYGLTWFFAGL
jgi:hypothetical protein